MMQPLLRAAAALAGLVGLLALAGPAAALDLNSFRAQHRLPALSVSSELSGAAYEHAHALAGRGRLDHAGFRQRVGSIASATGGNGRTYWVLELGN